MGGDHIGCFEGRTDEAGSGMEAIEFTRAKRPSDSAREHPLRHGNPILQARRGKAARRWEVDRSQYLAIHEWLGGVLISSVPF